MRKLIIAGVIAVATASAAQSEGIMNGGIMSMIKPDASVEYGIKTKKWSGDVSGDSIAISGASVKSTLAISNSLSAYSKLSLDKDFKYTDLSIGVAIAFK